jgi:hypothetical protein
MNFTEATHIDDKTFLRNMTGTVQKDKIKSLKDK